MHNWLDKYIKEQKEQREIINKIIHPCTYDVICNFFELDEIEMQKEEPEQ